MPSKKSKKNNYNTCFLFIFYSFISIPSHVPTDALAYGSESSHRYILQQGSESHIQHRDKNILHTFHLEVYNNGFGTLVLLSQRVLYRFDKVHPYPVSYIQIHLIVSIHIPNKNVIVNKIQSKLVSHMVGNYNGAAAYSNACNISHKIHTYTFLQEFYTLTF